MRRENLLFIVELCLCVVSLLHLSSCCCYYLRSSFFMLNVLPSHQMIWCALTKGDLILCNLSRFSYGDNGAQTIQYRSRSTRVSQNEEKRDEMRSTNSACGYGPLNERLKICVYKHKLNEKCLMGEMCSSMKGIISIKIVELNCAV